MGRDESNGGDGKILEILSLIIQQRNLKGTVYVISTDSQFIDLYVRFTMVPYWCVRFTMVPYIGMSDSLWYHRLECQIHYGTILVCQIHYGTIDWNVRFTMVPYIGMSDSLWYHILVCQIHY